MVVSEISGASLMVDERCLNRETPTASVRIINFKDYAPIQLGV
jgi:hypothetical protein